MMIDFYPNPPPSHCRRLSTSICLQNPIDVVFAFFADASNLQSITPPTLDFQILTTLPIEMTAGTMIDYRLRLRHVPIRWKTEITVWEPPYRFVDRQVRGPYAVWEHTHTFVPQDGGTEVRDDVVYQVPRVPMIERYFVRPELKKIFQFRHESLSQIFGLQHKELAPRECP